MKDFSAEGRQEPEIATAGPGMDAPLWLLQKDDSHFLYISLFLSVTVHIILFVVMAATRIFHPLAGSSQKFDLVWFSQAPVTAPMESVANKPPASKKKSVKTLQSTPAPKPRPATITKVKKEPQPPPPAKTKSPPTKIPPQASPATAEVHTAKEAPTEEPAEMVISRFSGTVVEVVDKKALPTFTVISSVKMKSEATRAVVLTIRETGKESRKQQETPQKSKPSEAEKMASLPKSQPRGQQAGARTDIPNPASQTRSDQHMAQEKPIQGKISSSSVATEQKSSPTQTPVHRPINSFAAALESLSATGSKLAASEQLSSKAADGATRAEDTSSLQSPSVAMPPTLPPAVEKPAVPEVKQAPKLPPPPQRILHPPITGDLKLVITGDVEVKVEISFRPFPRNRRSKPFTRREAENRQSTMPKMVRTKENVQEAVVEVTEEGIYTIVIKPANGKTGTAQLQLRIRETAPGAATKNLGSRNIEGTFEVARVLMPEGILWNDDSNFTGDMEDADSITKFHSGSGLMWREYK